MHRASDVGAMALLTQCVRTLRAGMENEHVYLDAPEPTKSVGIVLAHLAESACNAADAIMMLDGHGMWEAAVMMERACFEYMVRAHYSVRHPDYAQWSANIEVLWAHLQHNDRYMTDKEKRMYGDEIRRQERRFPHLTTRSRLDNGEVPFHQIRFTEMMQEVIGNADTDEYRVQSMLMHGKLYGKIAAAQIDHFTANLAIINAATDVVEIGILLAPGIGQPVEAYEPLRKACEQAQEHYRAAIQRRNERRAQEALARDAEPHTHRSEQAEITK